MKYLRLLPLLLLLGALSGCATPPADLEAKGAVPAGTGSFSVAIVNNSNYRINFYQPNLPWYVLSLFDEGPSGKIYNVSLHYDAITGVEMGYGALPAGSYRLMSLETSFPVGNGVEYITAPLSRSMAPVQIVPGQHLDLGVLFFEQDPSGTTRLAFGWTPSPADVAAGVKTYVGGRETVTAIAPWTGMDPTLNQLTTYVFNNPAPEDLRVYASGVMLVPARLGRVMYRDDKQAWHILYVGRLNAVYEADMLKDGRILAMLDDYSVQLSDATRSQWHALALPVAKADDAHVGVLDDGRLYLYTKDSWQTIDPGTHQPTLQYGYSVYLRDADQGGWKLLQHLVQSHGVRVDEHNVYMYQSHGKLIVTDFRSGVSREAKAPADELVASGNGMLLAYGGLVDIFNTTQYVSTDAGASWHELTNPSGDFERDGQPFVKSPGVVMTKARERGADKQWSAWGYYETSDYGATWKQDFLEPVGHCGRVVQTARFQQGKFWEVCDNAGIWSFDPATRDSVRERDMLESASIVHN
jgi:hypothetical protein